MLPPPKLAKMHITANTMESTRPSGPRPNSFNPTCRYCIGPPSTVPSGLTVRYIWPSVHSTNLLVMPNRPQANIQKNAPGPPSVMAIVTPAMFPRPTVADRADERA